MMLLKLRALAAITTAALLLAVSSQEAHGQTSRTLARSDSTDVLDVVARYHRALATSDSAEALRLLAPDAVILESGGAETVAEYRAHHLPADIAFAAAVPSNRTVTR
ncbi:MAG TPA: hypothetical protein VFO66_01560, partial [Gemmatimonadaceae bacterium]|nr:hypothetical protein [Gemmatimonadaceae bacterium]